VKIEVDLSEVFDDEDGNVVRPSFKDAIMAEVVERIHSDIAREVSRKILEIVDKEAAAEVSRLVATAMDGAMDREYTPVSLYGQKEATTTLRKKIYGDIEKAMVWKDGHYDSDQSPYTRQIKKAVEAKLANFQKEYNKEVDVRFVADCMEYARVKLQERIGIKEAGK